MFRFLRLWLGAILRLFRSRQSLLVENLALRQQLSVFKRRNRRRKLVALDKLFWVMARRFWSDWKKSLLVVGRSGNGGPLAWCRLSPVLEHDLQDQKAGWQKQDLPRSA
jgi:hypothetical protein